MTTAGGTQTVPLRWSHVLSTYAVGCGAGVIATVSLILVVGVPLSIVSRPPASLPQIGSALALMSPFAGILYVELIWWLPRQLTWRMLVYAALSVLAFGPMVVAERPGAALDGGLVLTAGAGALIPIAVRVVLWISVRSIASVMGLWPNQSLAFLFMGVIAPVVGFGQLIELVRAAPVPAATVAVVIIGLAGAIWTSGIRTREQLPRWFTPFGVALALLLAVVGAVSLAG